MTNSVPQHGLSSNPNGSDVPLVLLTHGTSTETDGMLPLTTDTEYEAEGSISPPQQANVKPPWHSRLSNYFEDNWTPEIIAIVFSAVCLGAIGIVLKVYDGHPVPNLPNNISVNAIISVLATVAKSSLLYVVAAAIGQSKWDWFSPEPRNLRDFQHLDEASRGPLGSFWILWGPHVWSISSLGAVVTILALAVDPFIQQVVQYPSEPRTHPSNNVWTERVPFPSYYSNESDLTYVGAISGAVWNEASVYDRQARCPTGNCTWPLFESLGWRVKIQKVTDLSQVVVDCDIASNPTVLKGPPVRIARQETIPLGDQDCKIYFDKSTNASLTYPIQSMWLGNGTWETEGAVNFPAWREALYITTFPLEIIGPMESPFDKEHKILGVSNPVVALGHVQFEMVGNRQKDDAPQQLKLVYAEQTVLSLCTSQLDITVRDGITSIVSRQVRFGNSYVDNTTTLGPGATCWYPGSKPASISGPIRTMGNVKYITDNATLAFCTTSWKWGSDVVNRLSSVRTVKKTEKVQGDKHVNINTTANWVDEWNAGPWQSNNDVFEQIQSRSLGGVLQPIAASLTRLLETRGTEKATGVFISYETFVRVQWKWLILPYCVVLLGAVFLVAVMHRGRNGSRLWKGSLLAVLYHGLEDDKAGRESNRVSDMGRAAEATEVRLVFSDKGYRLVQT